MGFRTVPEKISAFLVRCSGRKYCDRCIQERLGLRWRQQVQLVTATLAVTPSFERELARCCTCNELKQVISVKKDLAAPAGPSVGAPFKPGDTDLLRS